MYWPPSAKMRFNFFSLPLSCMCATTPRLSPCVHFPSALTLWFLSFLTCWPMDELFFVSSAYQLILGPSFNLFCWVPYFLSSRFSLFLVYSLILILVQHIIFHEKSCWEVTFRLWEVSFPFVFVDSLAWYRILDWKSFRSWKALLLGILVSIVTVEELEGFVWNLVFFLESSRVSSLTLGIWNFIVFLFKNLCTVGWLVDPLIWKTTSFTFGKCSWIISLHSFPLVSLFGFTRSLPSLFLGCRTSLSSFPILLPFIFKLHGKDFQPLCWELFFSCQTFIFQRLLLFLDSFYGVLISLKIISGACCVFSSFFIVCFFLYCLPFSLVFSVEALLRCLALCGWLLILKRAR